MATRARDRIFAWVGVVVIVVSVGALSAAVIIQNILASNSTTPPDTQSSALSCNDGSASEPTFAAPPKFTVAQPVTDLQVTDVSEGTGAAAKDGDCLVVKYYGTLAKDGTMFDENYTKPEAFAFSLGQGQVIQGWDKGMAGAKEGGERRLVIPAAQAYGDSGSGSIPPKSDLVFYVKLLRIQK
jgi:peptidylprolyl isomerase